MVEHVRNADIAGRVLAEVVPAIIIPILAVALRFWARIVLPPDGLTPRIWWDDWIALITLTFAIAQSISSILWAHLDLGQHVWDIPFDRLVENMRYLQLQIYLWNIGVALSNLSVLFFYARVFTKINKKFKYAIWAVGSLNVGWWFTAFWSAIFQCWPVQSAWNIFSPDRVCLDYYPWFLSIAAINILIDVLILLLPLPILVQLQISWTQRLLTLIVFTCGGAVLACAITRQVVLVNMGPDFIWDPMYHILPIGRIVSVEVPICIVAGSMPVIFSLCIKALKYGPLSLFSTRESLSNAPLVNGINGDEHSWTQRSGSTLNEKRLSSSDEDLMSGYMHRQGLTAADEERSSMQAGYSTTIERGSPYPDSSDGDELSVEAAVRPSSHIHVKKVIDVKSEPGTHPSVRTRTSDLSETYHRSWYEGAPRTPNERSSSDLDNKTNS